jgi:hypothetical protein
MSRFYERLAVTTMERVTFTHVRAYYVTVQRNKDAKRHCEASLEHSRDPAVERGRTATRISDAGPIAALLDNDFRIFRRTRAVLSRK